MDLRARQSWSPRVRAHVARAAGLGEDELEEVGAFESFVFRAPHPSGTGYLKATWSGRRTPEQILAEVHFVEFLADQGARVARPLAFPGGGLVVTVPGEAHDFHLSWFAEAPGRLLRTEPWSTSMITAWGATLGRLHRLAGAYGGPPEGCARPAWTEEYSRDADPSSDRPEILERYAETVDAVAALPRSPEDFGPMHGDVHHNNVHWERGVPWVFDFDDMMDFWFISDLAVALYYEALRAGPELAQRRAAFERALTPLITGYLSERTLRPEELARLPLFLKLREQDLRAAMLRSVPPASRSEWLRRFLEETAVRITEGQPALGVRVAL